MLLVYVSKISLWGIDSGINYCILSHCSKCDQLLREVHQLPPNGAKLTPISESYC